MTRAIFSSALVSGIISVSALWGQTPLGVPTIAAEAKGPSQINLTWVPVLNPGYGYLVEIQSAGDERYAGWQELRPIPDARGYTCDSTVVFRNSTCRISDPNGNHVYNLPINGIPYWVTEPTYVDPVDGSPAQFIVWGLRPNTLYTFRVRTYSGNTATAYGSYSNTATATTANYTARYVSTTGNDANNGSAPDAAWRSLRHASEALSCGQVLLVKGGNYANDALVLQQNCGQGNRAVVLVTPGETATITSAPAGFNHAVNVRGSYIVIDSLKTLSSSVKDGDYDVMVEGSHNALLNMEVAPPVVPAFKSGVTFRGGYNLLYRSYLHDYGSPDVGQNPSGNDGWVFEIEGAGAVGNVIWSNHLTRGGHDNSLCIRGCRYNRWLNNIFDGGWSMAWEGISNAQFNLVEGSIIKSAGQLVNSYKPAIEISDSNNTVRRNIAINSKSNGLEVSALYGGERAVNNLVYNNVFYVLDLCYFQSRNNGVAAYDGNVYANNICYKFRVATDIYLANKNSKIVNNSILAVNEGGDPDRDKKIIIWNHSGGGDFEYPVTLADADRNYNPPFANNKGLDRAPQFVDEAKFDFHLQTGSPLRGGGINVLDETWGTAPGTVDLGPYGLSRVSTALNPPKIAANGIVNAASYALGPVAPGEIVVLFGSGLGPATLTSLRLDEKGNVATTLADTQVLFDGVPAPLIYTHAQQLSAIVPYAVHGRDQTVVQVAYQGVLSDPMTLKVADASPAIFTTAANGTGQGAIVNQDGTVNSAANPAPRGSHIAVYGTGEGQTKPAGVDGKLVTAALTQPLANVDASIGGLVAQVTYAGGPPGLTAGVLQVNLQVPEGVSPGNTVPVSLRIGSFTTQPDVTMAVQ